jgi:hypothetical protein
LVLAGFAVVAAAALGVAVARGGVAADRLAAMAVRDRAFWSIWPTFLVAALAIAALGSAAFVTRRAGLAVAAFALFPLALLTVALPAVSGYARTRSAKPLAEALASIPSATEVACVNSYPAGLSFYLGRTLTLIGEDATPLRSNFVLYSMRHAAVRPATVVAPSQRDLWLGSRKADTIVLAPDDERAGLEGWLGSRFPVRALTSGWWGAFIPPAEAH